MKAISQYDEPRGFNKYKLNYANVNRAGTYEHWKCENVIICLDSLRFLEFSQGWASLYF